MRAIGVCSLFVCGCNAFFDIHRTNLELPDAPPLIDAIGCSGSTFTGLVPFPYTDPVSAASDPALTADFTQLWFDQQDPVTTHNQVFFATGSQGGTYSGDNRAPFIEAGTESTDPALTEDGLRLAFIRTNSVFEVSRAAITDPFPATASPLGSLGNAQSIALSRDGLVAYFDNNGEIFSATRTKLMDSFSAPVDLQVAGFNPTVSPDQLEIFYDTTGFPGANVERRVRATVTSPFGPPDLIQSNAYEPSISWDSRTLLMVQTSTPVIMMMTRTCP